MDIGAFIGLAVAFGGLFAMIFMEGASPAALLLPAPMILVFGGAIGAALASTTLPDAIQSFKTLPKALLYKATKPRTTVDTLVELAEVARKDGLLALEAKAADIDDPFLRKALQNVADGVDADELRIMMEDEAATRERTTQAASKFFNSLGGYAPTIGILGTVVSLTHVLENLSDPSHLGESIASAFVATLWGVLSANLLWLPFGSRIGKIVALESERLAMITEGVMALQAGMQPRVLGDKLLAMVPEHEQGGAEKTAAKAGAKAKGKASADAAAA